MGRARHLRGFGAKIYNSVRVRSYNHLLHNPQDNKMFSRASQPTPKELKQRRKTKAIIERGMTVQEWEKEEKDIENRHKEAIDRRRKVNPNR